MVNERLQEDMATMLSGLSHQMRSIAEVQKKRSLLTATVLAEEKRIEVTVNADGLLIDTKFAGDILDLTMDEIAAALTRAVQDAAAEVQKKARVLMDPLLEHRESLPKLSEMIDGAPDMGDVIPRPPVTPTMSPDSPDWPGNKPGDPDDEPPRSLVADHD
ncbi:YbaB/EbfC family nucleoid-associated protein [Nocardia flavorosea]|uniref:YbaB/EbfC family nucleoid-associated protein n=1 Tax=Nocardia flavorosea TaxID=53429 RepID=A0A846YP18_9NOCA|nr:YbaB/EbfC family nucleoid-associated protein [Nocardia flavorosea]NKY60867.1 YbaB/EbfC family nucleoid-associated protein [Nocardia flavorosea]